ncbi:MAG: PLP-dependent aminotransferase family protein [Fervidicoccaceae archaeon]
MLISNFFSDELKLYRQSDVRELLKVTEQKKVISFGGGLPDFSLFPFKKAIELLEETLIINFQKAMQYAPTKGISQLIDALKDLMKLEYKLEGKEYDDLIILTGSQQGLDLTARALINPGDIIIVEKPTYLAALNSFRPRKPIIYGVNQDSNGLNTYELESLLREIYSQGKKVKLLYTIPSNHNPAGTTIPEDRRKHLYELAVKYDFLIYEDDPYNLITFEGEPVKPIKSLDQEGRVIYMSTLSKILSPGLRIGWIMAERPLIEALELVKQVADLHTSTLSQFIAIEWIKRKIYKEFLTESLPVYRRKRDMMLSSLEENFSNYGTWTKPRGGLFLMMSFNNKINTRDLLKISMKKGVVFVPGEAFFHDGSGTNTMRLNFSYPTEKEIVNGMHLLKEAFLEMRGSTPSS